MSEIHFPGWVKITRCEHTSRSRSFRTAHGRVKFVTYEPTHHGAVMSVWRARHAS